VARRLERSKIDRAANVADEGVEKDVRQKVLLSRVPMQMKAAILADNLLPAVNPTMLTMSISKMMTNRHQDEVVAVEAPKMNGLEKWSQRGLRR
jgi:hypothetical protein